MSRSDLPSTMTFQSKDPTQPLRFVPPSTPLPFERKRLTVKQIDPKRLDEAGAHALTMFSSWRDTWKDNKDRDVEDAQAMLESLSPAGGKYEVKTEELPNRRFSGDWFLSPSRYFSVCESRDGHDGGTMLRELTAYHDPWTKGVIDIIELTDNQAESATSNLVTMEKEPAILISIPPFTATEHEWLRSAAACWETTRIVLPAPVTEITLERLVDLRVPHVATWFTRNLTRLRWLTDDGSDAPAFRNKAPLDSFHELLPTLAAQIHGGGNGATRIAGQWLRSLGADGLIFPSARSDVRVDISGGDVSSFYGWNLVDYRGAHPARLQTFDLTPYWSHHVANEIDELPLSIYSDISLESEAEGDRQGSWRWRNIEKANHATRLLASALHLYGWARPDVSTEQERLLEAMLGATDRAEALSATAGWFVRALLGDSVARQALLDSSVELPSEEARTVDLLGTFRAMDERVAAGKTGKLS